MVNPWDEARRRHEERIDRRVNRRADEHVTRKLLDAAFDYFECWPDKDDTFAYALLDSLDLPRDPLDNPDYHQYPPEGHGYPHWGL